MTEKEYCLSKFEETFQNLKGKRIALYGTGAYAHEIINNIIKKNSEWQLVCVVDDAKVDKYMDGYCVISTDQMVNMAIDSVIIAAQIRSAESVYNRIWNICRTHGIGLFNLYGKDMYILHEDVYYKDYNYPQKIENDIFKEIDRHDVVSFDIDDTLFMLKEVLEFDFFREVQMELINAGVNLYYFANEIVDLKKQNTFSSLCQLIHMAIRKNGLSEVSNDFIYKVLDRVLLREYVPRKAVLEVIKYAISNGKEVYLIADIEQYRFDKVVLEELLKTYEVVGYKDIVCSVDFKKNKYSGLYRIIKDKIGEKNCVHIGDDREADIIVPQLYGMDTFWIKNSMEMFQRMDQLETVPNEKKTVRRAFVQYLMEVYKDEYVVEKIEEKCIHSHHYMNHLKNLIEFYKSKDEVFGIEEDEICIDLVDNIDFKENIDEYPKLEFRVYEKPLVSIIIPVYNQFQCTYNCLNAILQHTDRVAFEIVIADDCSTDQVSELEKVVHGIRILHNQENLKFLLNCNEAAKCARGEYILFLNNDTQVQKGWLKALLDLMEQNKDAGMVGAKLLYPQGFLQEAGGILWKDGSAWNYGHMENPNKSEFCYVKEADYISGAAIMIRTSLWKEIGGFDERYAPAYYEDTDLAFEVRKHGYKVMFQPASLVVHFEGISNGTDIASGLKTYQVVNQQKFFDKWKDVLGKEHFKNGKNVYLAKDRGQKKTQILVVDHYVPNFDNDAGGRCTYMYIKAFLKMGMKVVFIGDNFAKPEPYTTHLMQLGVEVLYGDFSYKNKDKWLEKNLKYFDYVYLQRPHISIKYIDIAKKYSRAKIFYFAHDLHHVRMYRDYLLTGNEQSLKDSEHWKKIEMKLFENADVGHVVGSYEQEVMQKALPEKPVRNIPLYIYDDMPERIEKDFAKRKDILFVGGFSHAPNIDAVIWFAKEIFPKILKKYPDMVWHIVGSKAPAEVLELASEHIVLEGFVSDEELGELYRKCRLIVVPLRYGAGVKGKIVEAAYYQIPVVTTAIGGEGIDDTVGSFVMEDDADKMAELVESLYADYEQLRKMSDAGRTLIEEYFTSKAAERVLLQDMNIR